MTDDGGDFPLHRFECRGLRGSGRVTELLAVVNAEPWLIRALRVVAISDLPEAWVGAGVIRDVVWGRLNGGFDPATVKDVDVAFFDPTDLRKQHDRDAELRLGAIAELPWEATNQAAVHTWYHDYFGGAPLRPFTCVHDAVATWPETATSVALRVAPSGIDVCAPHGLDDLLDGVWRRNATLVSPDVSLARLARHEVGRRWPSVRVDPP